jgi:two-component system, OmpR family, sensor histidine kinase VicK
MNRSKAVAKPMFISLRWRLLLPITIGVMIVAMIGAYLIANSLTDNYSLAEDNIVLQSSASVMNRIQDVYAFQRNEAIRIAFTEGIAEAVLASQSTSLQPILESLARVSNLDSIIVTNAQGLEIVGLMRVTTQGVDDYSVSANSGLQDESIIKAILGGADVSTAFLRTSEGLLLYMAVPITKDNQQVGVAMVGQRLDAVTESLKASAVADVTLYTPEGELGATTVNLTTDSLGALQLNEGIRNQTFLANTAVKSSLSWDSGLYRVVYAPFVYGQDTLGIVATMTPNNVPFATAIGRQLIAIFASAVSAMVVIVGYVVISRSVGRMETVTATAQALAHGKVASRTHLQAVDEIGAVGQALDRFADASQAREDQLKTMLFRERRERTYLLSVLESMPNGIVVQDIRGQVLVMNEQARLLLGTQTAFQNLPFNLNQAVNAVLGQALAPGIYALGKPQQIAHNGTMLSAQAAAILSPAKERLGTVILLRDITQQVQQEQARDAILSQLQREVEQPLFDSAQQASQSQNQLVNDFAREISRHAASLQKMIVDMRELTRYTRTEARHKQRALSVETLVWAVANDWRQIAQAANLSLQVTIGKQGLLVLGDESRLRLAIGNILDNAIKYTPSGGTVTLEIKDEIEGAVHLRVRDNGVGINGEDMANLFVPFYRGTPTANDGTLIRVPGMGQGLPLAKQIIEAHGGIIRVKTRLGVGTAVYLALPLTAGVGFKLPINEPAMMEGDTVLIPDNVDIESYWKRA